jgi:alpha-beta hydrolase superfamily lysophospholipase
MILVLAVSAVVALFVVASILAWVLQERVAFQPERPPFPEAGLTPRVDYTASDGQKLFAYVVGDPQHGSGLVLAFHGNADLAVRQIEWAQEIVNRTGLAVMLAEYRGYMGLKGKPTYEGSRFDSEAAYMCAREKFGVPKDHFAFFGHSLGTAIATELAVKHPPRALLLEAPFTSAHDMAALVTGRWLSSLLWPAISRLHFDTRSLVGSLTVPVSVSHGGRDNENDNTPDMPTIAYTNIPLFCLNKECENFAGENSDKPNYQPKYLVDVITNKVN